MFESFTNSVSIQLLAGTCVCVLSGFGQDRYFITSSMCFDAEQRFKISSSLWLVWVWILSRCHCCLFLFSFKFELACIYCFHTSQSGPSDCSNPLLPSFLKHQCQICNAQDVKHPFSVWKNDTSKVPWTPNEPHSQQLLWLQTTKT